MWDDEGDNQPSPELLPMYKSLNQLDHMEFQFQDIDNRIFFITFIVLNFAAPLLIIYFMY